MLDVLRVSNIPGLRFIIMDNGPLMEKHYNQAENLNVTFTGRPAHEQIFGALYVCGIVINPIVDLSSATIINKHVDYAAAGKSVANTQNDRNYRDLVDEYQMSFN